MEHFLNAKLAMKLKKLETNWGTTQTNMSGCDLNGGRGGQSWMGHIGYN